MCVCVHACTPVDERERLVSTEECSLPAGALRRAWAAVWFSVCIRGGGV